MEENKRSGKTKKIVLSLILIIVLAIIGFIIYEVATVNKTYYIWEKNLQIPLFVYHDIVIEESQIETVPKEHRKRGNEYGFYTDCFSR